ncbi:hypothetical protein [Nocardioides abyssi]|uniref:Uncharacterized protein n=1 Tax=Nocardioides abyssi TaxID=3058370 RepID=A0ABT8EZK2_9ACTN|nr:hypothetical protein [Nocardioides abyssi]MDN4163583.1 hypothetical protein [Nocardioides abyssi]
MFKQMTSTAQIPSGFAMPACGHAWFDTTGVVAGAATTGVITTGVVRDRQEDSVHATVLAAAVIGKRDAIRTQDCFPGTTAWRPPIC